MKKLLSLLFLSIFFISLASAVPQIEFVFPTPDNATVTENTSVIINTSITESNLANVTFNWNGTNITRDFINLILLYNLDNSSYLGENDSYIVNSIGDGNDGTVSGATWTSDGKYNGAYSFDGVNDYIAKENTNTNFPTGTFTLTAWIKPTTIVGTILSWGERSGTHTGFKFSLGNTDELRFTTFAVKDYDTTTFHLVTGEYQFVAVVFDSSYDATFYHYLPSTGVLATQTVTHNVDMNNPGTDADIILGAYHNAVNDLSSLTNFFNGTIDEVALYNNSLSSDEIVSLYKSNLAKYDENKWNLYVNQSNLSYETYTYQSFATDFAGNSNSTDLRYLSVSEDSCSCPGLNQNWVVNFSHFCTLTTCDLGIGNFSVTNSTGWMNITGIIKSKSGFFLFKDTPQTIFINGTGGFRFG